MDPLSITASIVGILSATGKVSKLLGSIVSSTQDAPQVTKALICEVNDIQSALSSLQVLLDDLSSSPQRRSALIQLDQLIVTLTESVLTISELETILSPFVASPGQALPFRTRLKWARVEGSCLNIVERLQRHKSSISLMLNILQCATDAEANRSRASLELLIGQLLNGNKELCRRLKNLEDAFDARSTLTKKIDKISFVSQGDDKTITTAQPSTHEPEPILEAIKVRFAFDDDLESSRVYRLAKSDFCDSSFVSSAIRTNAWSIFSGLSLADISVISVVALPLYPGDIANQQHYSFGDTVRPSRVLGGPDNEAVLCHKWVEEFDAVAVKSEHNSGNLVPRSHDLLKENSDASQHLKSRMANSHVDLLPNRDFVNESLSVEVLTQIDNPSTSTGWIEHSEPTDFHSNLDQIKARSTTSLQDLQPASQLNVGSSVVKTCSGCELIIEGGNAFEIFWNYWHADCFRCTICDDFLENDPNILLLGDGTLICNKGCKYTCHHCRKTIHNDAILAEDEAFHGYCFRCGNCKRKIDDVPYRQYVRTSQGVFCMNCHESLMARRRMKSREARSGSKTEKTNPSVPTPAGSIAKEACE